MSGFHTNTHAVLLRQATRGRDTWNWRPLFPKFLKTKIAPEG